MRRGRHHDPNLNSHFLHMPGRLLEVALSFSTSSPLRKTWRWRHHLVDPYLTVWICTWTIPHNFMHAVYQICTSIRGSVHYGISTVRWMCSFAMCWRDERASFSRKWYITQLLSETRWHDNDHMCTLLQWPQLKQGVKDFSAALDLHIYQRWSS